MCKSLIVLFIILFASCSEVNQNAPCPTCTPIALHFAFVDSLTLEKIQPQQITIIKNNKDTFALINSIESQPRFSINQKNYYFEGDTGVYKIVITDSTYGHFVIDSLNVVPNQEYINCGILPLTIHLKISVFINTGLNKSKNSSDYIIKEKYMKGSCQ